jgi:LysM repeat protein
MPRLYARSLALVIAVAIPAPMLAQTPATDVPATHTVKEGDTLWDLARQYYSDPLQWPRIYQMNTGVVEDPHWIYPGEVLRLSSDGAVVSVPADTSVPVAATPVEAAAATEAPPAADSSSRESAEVVAPVAVAEEATVTDTTPIFPRSGTVMSGSVIRAEFNDNFRAVTHTEFLQAGFMTEGKSLPYGKLLGPVAPTQVEATGTQASRLYSAVAIEPPAPGAYQVGDTVVAVWEDPRGFGGNGHIIVPVGLIRITDVSRPQALGIVVAQYNSIIPGTKILPAEKYTERPGVRSQPIADGVEGTIIAFRAKDVLRGIGDIVFVDRGSSQGMALGDIIEAHRTIEPRDKIPVVIPEVVARLQVVHVGEQTATTRVIWVQYPDIPLETKWKTVGKLPG